MSDTENPLNEDHESENQQLPDETEDAVKTLLALCEKTNAELNVKIKNIAQLQREVQDLKNKRASLLKTINLFAPGTVATDDAHIRAPRAPRGKSSETVKMVVQILKEHNHPMHYKDIYKALCKKGHLIVGKDPANSMLTRMSFGGKKDLFAKPSNARRGTYILAEWQTTDGGKANPAACPLCVELNAT